MKWFLWLALSCIFWSAIGIAGERSDRWLAPVALPDRSSWDGVWLTSNGYFGLIRKARPTVPAHLHTAIDIGRPSGNYDHEPVYPAAAGRAISIRSDGPFAFIILEHRLDSGDTVWTVYEHIAGIGVALGDRVPPDRPIARFMNTAELERYGRQFDHLHFEVLKVRPRPLRPLPNMPFRLFSAYTLECYTAEDLMTYYHDPVDFLSSRWQREGKHDR